MPMFKSVISGAAVVFVGSMATAEPVLPTFDLAIFANPAPNPYIDLTIGWRQVLAGSGSENGEPVTETTSQIVTGHGPVLMGVQTTQIMDEAIQNGLLVERAFDYYANDAEGNLWYFGEDVTNYKYDDQGHLIGSDSHSSWRAGDGGAVPGISVVAKPVVGLSLFQEMAKEQGATDYFEVIEVDGTLTGPGGTYDHVLKVFEGSQSELDLREFKYLVPGLGTVRADDLLSEARDNPELVIERPAGM